MIGLLLSLTVLAIQSEGGRMESASERVNSAQPINRVQPSTALYAQPNSALYARLDSVVEGGPLGAVEDGPLNAEQKRYQRPPLTSPTLVSILTDSRLVEMSGLAPSQLDPKMFWAINDGGHSPDVWAIDAKGNILRSVKLEILQNLDFEDITSYREGGSPRGKPMLAIGDFGDNAAVRGEYSIWVIAEPRQGETTAKIRQHIRYRYPDRAHDAESLGVDAKAGFFYIATKRVTPSILYRIPIRPKRPNEVQVAEEVGPLLHIQPDNPDSEFPSNRIRYAAQPTSMSMGCDGKSFYLLTYSSIYRYQRSAKQSWKEALVTNTPSRLMLPPMLQAEAIAQTANCDALYVGSEKVPSPFFRFDAKP